MLRASAQVVGSPTVGPEPMSVGLSPGTSEITSVTTFAGKHAAARRPPLMPERWRRTQFISPIGAPEVSSARLSACLSSSARPASGNVSRAEAPPDINASTRSSWLSPWTLARMRSLDDLDALAWHGVAAARHDQARQRNGPVVLDCLRHGGRGLAGTDYDELPAGRCRQKALDMPSGLRRIDCGIEQAAQQGARIDGGAHAPRAAPAAIARVFMRVPMPSIETSTVAPSGIEPTPIEVPQAMTSPGSSDMSCEMRLTSSAGGRIMSLSA